MNCVRRIAVIFSRYYISEKPEQVRIRHERESDELNSAELKTLCLLLSDGWRHLEKI